MRNSERRNQQYNQGNDGRKNVDNVLDPYYNEDGRDKSRGWWEKAGDEMLSWMGDDYAERRRRHDGPHKGKGPRGYVRSDERIREEINDKLTDEWRVDATDIEVQVARGEVTLTGFVSDRYQKRRAEDVAEHVSGVRHIENRIKVEIETPKDNVNLIP